MSASLEARSTASRLALGCGDAVGATAEFAPRDRLATCHRAPVVAATARALHAAGASP